MRSIKVRCDAVQSHWLIDTFRSQTDQMEHAVALSYSLVSFVVFPALEAGLTTSSTRSLFPLRYSSRRNL